MSDDNEPPRKIQRLEESDNSGILQSSNNAEKESSLSILENQDKKELLIKLIFANTNDVAFLTKCRLVNQDWNGRACEKLRLLTIVKLDEDDEHIEDIIAMLLDRSLGNLAFQPFPFKNFHVIGTKFINFGFNQLIRSKSIVVTKCSLEQCDEERMDVVTAKEFLLLHQSTLTTLIISTVHTSVVVNVFAGVRFSSLKTLIVKTPCFVVSDDQTCQHIEALRKALQNSALSSLTITISSDVCFTEFLQMNLSQIELLNLKLSTISNWHDFEELRLPKLKRLYLLGNAIDSEDFYLWINGFFGNVAPTLTKLCHNFSRELGMAFPYNRLTSLKVPGRTFADLLTFIALERFLHLQNLHLLSCTVQHFIIPPGGIHTQQELRPHLGIKKLGIKIEDVIQIELQEHFFVWLTYIKRVFPNIEDVGVSYEHDGWTSNFLLYTYSVFPDLKTIRIISPCDFDALAGTIVELFMRCLESGLLAENIPRRNSIFDFKELEKLVLGSECIVSNDLIIHCLCKLPKLKQIRIPWSSDISTEVFANSCQQFRKLEITYFDEPNHYLSALRQLLPNCLLNIYESQGFGTKDES